MVNTIQYSKNEVLNFLAEICDPEIPIVSIQEIGILRDIHLHENTIEVVITPTYAGCPAMSIIEKDIISLLQNLNFEHITVTTSLSPAWTTDWMSNETKEKLRKFGIAAPMHSSCVNWFQPTSLIVHCPRCNSSHTKVISQFGSTGCKALYKCQDCLEPFDFFKCH